MAKKPKKTYVDEEGKRQKSMYSDLKEGAFTAQCKKMGYDDVQECAKYILANPDKYSATTVKRARFAKTQEEIR